ncbi:MAG: hypothetical protein O9301_04190 [Leptospira sp.]|nr:hypothetical protein [Leptospira sp.]
MKRFLIFLFFLFSCREGTELQKKENEEQSAWMFTIAILRSQGNCKIKEFKNETENVSCDRRPRGLCTVEEKILSQGEISKQISDARKITDSNTNCLESVIASEILNLKPTTETEKMEIYSKFLYETINSCEEIGLLLSEGERLASLEEYLFLVSVPGKIGRSANTLRNFPLSTISTKEKANDCFVKNFTDKEREILEDFRKGKTILSKKL